MCILELRTRVLYWY